MSTYDDIFLQAMEGNTNIVSENYNRDIQKGKVISIHDNGYFIALGGKSEMVLPQSEASGILAVGDELEVVYTGSKDGVLLVSQKKADRIKVQEELYHASAENTPIVVTITKMWLSRDNKEVGYIADVKGVEVFLPFSQIKTPSNNQELIGHSVTVMVIKHERDRVVVSERTAREKLQKEKFSQFVNEHHIGDKITVKVDFVSEAFALVSAEYVTMFLHITEFDWKYIKNLSEVLKLGDTFEVVILNIDLGKKSIKVSRKQAVENPMTVFFNTKKIGDNIVAKVIRFARGLAVLEDDNGVEMVLPVGEMSWVNKVSDPKHLLSISDRVEVKIKEMDSEKKRISVSLRDLLENPWKTANQSYVVNSKHQGTVKSITDFGIFVAFDDGIQGLLRKEDLNWYDNNVDMNAEFKKGDTISVMVMEIEPSKEKLRLGMKQLSENPFQNFADNHPVGSIVSGNIKSIVKDGVEVELEKELVAFIHISQLSVEKTEKIEDSFKVGDTVQAVVRKINIPQQKIELSIRELTRAEEQKEINKVLNSHVQEMPTLGALFGDILKKQ